MNDICHVEPFQKMATPDEQKNGEPTFLAV